MVKDNRVHAVILIRTVPTKEKSVALELSEKFFDNSKPVYFERMLTTLGNFDIVGFISGVNMKEIGNFVTKQLRQMIGIENTETLIAYE